MKTSAESIFHAHFMAALADAEVDIAGAHFLAPAIRNDVFHATVAPLLGGRLGALSVFTMEKQLEKDDSVAKVYRKSLLYLIYEALEARRQTDILGLEISLRNGEPIEPFPEAAQGARRRYLNPNLDVVDMPRCPVEAGRAR